jgi:hypothetical protein
MHLSQQYGVVIQQIIGMANVLAYELNRPQCRAFSSTALAPPLSEQGLPWRQQHPGESH